MTMSRQQGIEVLRVLKLATEAAEPGSEAAVQLAAQARDIVHELALTVMKAEVEIMLLRLKLSEERKLRGVEGPLAASDYGILIKALEDPSTVAMVQAVLEGRTVPAHRFDAEKVSSGSILKAPTNYAELADALNSQEVLDAILGREYAGPYALGVSDLDGVLEIILRVSPSQYTFSTHVDIGGVAFPIRLDDHFTGPNPTKENNPGG